jgi:hypothetical protein
VASAARDLRKSQEEARAKVADKQAEVAAAANDANKDVAKARADYVRDTADANYDVAKTKAEGALKVAREQCDQYKGECAGRVPEPRQGRLRARTGRSESRLRAGQAHRVKHRKTRWLNCRMARTNGYESASRAIRCLLIVHQSPALSRHSWRRTAARKSRQPAVRDDRIGKAGSARAAKPGEFPPPAAAHLTGKDN